MCKRTDIVIYRTQSGDTKINNELNPANSQEWDGPEILPWSSACLVPSSEEAGVSSPVDFSSVVLLSLVSFAEVFLVSVSGLGLSLGL